MALPPEPTPSTHDLPQRTGDFATLTEALDYAAGGETGLNFYKSGTLAHSLSYRQLRTDAVALAGKLLAAGAAPGDRVALVAETAPDFVRTFFACQYAGLVPVPLPAAVKIGAHAAFVNQLRGMLRDSKARLAVASKQFVPFLEEAGAGLDSLTVGSYETFAARRETDATSLPRATPGDTAFIQYTSGSTSAPKGVVITQSAAMNNLEAIARHGVRVEPGDRCVSWLPFYHDMGLVGFMLVPLASQLSVDYMPTHEFAMRPGQWLHLISANRATISFSPCFGFELCARRLRGEEARKYDLSSWRVAGVGAEMIRPRSLDSFAEALAPAGFDPRAFMPCYGMAECTVGVSFSTPGSSYTADFVNVDHLQKHGEVVMVDGNGNAGPGRHFVHCGRPLPGVEVEIRDDRGRALEDYCTGVIYLRTPSIMAGYFRLPGETREAIDEHGWLCTGDIGYRADGELTLTGRKKDLIIINGRNIWPQDIEQVCEKQPEVRVGEAVAFSIPDPEQGEACVALVQCRETNPLTLEKLQQRLTGLIRRELGLDCHVELVPPRSIPVTSSGKRSRARARQNFLAARDDAERTAQPQPRAIRRPKASAGF